MKWFTVRVFIADVDDTDMLEVMHTKVMAESAGEATELVVKQSLYWMLSNTWRKVE